MSTKHDAAAVQRLSPSSDGSGSGRADFGPTESSNSGATKKRGVTPLRAPCVRGLMLDMLGPLVDVPILGELVAAKYFSDAGVHAMRRVRTAAHEPGLQSANLCLGAPSTSPRLVPGLREEGAVAPEARASAPNSVVESVGDFALAYRTAKRTPLAVAEAVLAASKQADQLQPAMRIFISQDADNVRELAVASTKRWAAGRPLSPLDGVPVAIKDELDQTPYPSTVGKVSRGSLPAAHDAEVVARLRRAGALLIGKTNMHEIGLGVTGSNPHHGTARNPYDPRRATGGSSSGSAAAVAAGLCPIAMGADAGGSIRNPASLCGVVGLKPTFGRVSEYGAATLVWSVAHIGPLGATVRDVATAYAIVAGRDPHDPQSLGQPPVSLEDWDTADLHGVRLGIDEAWFGAAAPEIVSTCRAVCEELVSRGAEIVEIEVPDLDLLRTVHTVTVISEMAAAHSHGWDRIRSELGGDTRALVALGRRLRATDYLQAQRLRQRFVQSFESIFERVDAVMTPASGCTAPILTPAAVRGRELDPSIMEAIFRFSLPANITGLPAIALPAGYDSHGLPIGLHAMARPWNEALLLRVGSVVESLVERRRPAVHWRLLVD